MLPALKDNQSNYQRYSIVSKWNLIDEKQVAQYGIEQVTLDGNGNTIKTIVDDISDDKRVVLELLKRTEFDDVPSYALRDIVEDYIIEISTVL